MFKKLKAYLLKRRLKKIKKIIGRGDVGLLLSRLPDAHKELPAQVTAILGTEEDRAFLMKSTIRNGKRRDEMARILSVKVPVVTVYDATAPQRARQIKWN
jgi:hypothetical protein